MRVDKDMLTKVRCEDCNQELGYSIFLAEVYCELCYRALPEDDDEEE